MTKINIQFEMRKDLDSRKVEKKKKAISHRLSSSRNKSCSKCSGIQLLQKQSRTEEKMERVIKESSENKKKIRIFATDSDLQRTTRV